jgi:hypothetical protein
VSKEISDPRPAGDPWAGIEPDEALKRVRKSLEPRWYAWFSGVRADHDAPTGHIIWAGKRADDGMLIHADHPGTLLTVVVEADARAAIPAPRHVLGEL